jgi:AcrR family transcriptional regulator
MVQLRERKKRETRKRILEAAAALFAEEGFAATTMEAVAARAEVGVGTLYNYFGAKDRLLLGVFEDATEAQLEHGQTIVDAPGPDAEAAVCHLLGHYLSIARIFDKRVMRELLAASLVQPERIEEYASLDVQLAAQVAQLLAVLQARGDVARDVEVQNAALALYGALVMPLLLYLSMDGMDEGTLEVMVCAQVHTVFRGLAPRRDED